MKCGTLALVLWAAVAAGLSGHAATAAETAGDIQFRKTQLDDKFRSEGVAAGDFNHDGKLDIAAGSVWFAAPNWKPHALLETANQFDPKQYSDSFCNFVADVNGDGWDDLIVVDFPGKPTWWFENPQRPDVAWPRHLAVSVTNNESPALVDLERNGRRGLLFGTLPGHRMAFALPGKEPAAPWTTTMISAEGAPGTDRFSHGLGAGDVNGDGRTDVMITEGWWEAPAKPNGREWTFHAVSLGPACANMYAFDFDGDGDNDILSSSAHNYGLWWHEQTPDGFRMHVIDKSFSQSHSLCLADINGDGLPDFVTGKRWWAHSGHDPGADQPAVLYWYELNRQGGKPIWTAHLIDETSGVGTQFQVIDVSGDGLLDIVTANKRGVFYFQQVRMP